MAIRLPRLIRDFSIVSDKGYPTVSYHQWWETVLRQIESSFERIELALAAAGVAIDGMTSAVWGNITGTLADQTDLQAALDAKQDAGSYQDTLVSGTNIKTVNGNTLLGSGDLVISGGGSSAVAGQVVLTVPNSRISFEETLTATGVTPTSTVIIGLAPHLDSDVNAVELIDLLSVAAVPGTDQITVTASFLTPHAGPIRFNWSAF